VEQSPEGVPRPRISRQVGETLTQLARVTSELTTATTVDALTKIVTQHAADAVGATIAALALREGSSKIRLIGLRGLDAPEAAQWQVFPLETHNTVADVVRTGQRIVLVGAHEISARYPGLAERGERCVLTVPLRAAGRTIGAIHLSIPEPVPPHPAELEFLDILAVTCAQAVERIEAAATAEKQTSRLAFLAEASTQLNSSLDLSTTTARVARLAVPRFADWCAIDVVRDGSLHRLAVAHPDPRKAELAAELQARWPNDPESPTSLMEIVRTGRPMLFPDITDEMLVASARDEEHLAAMRELGMRSLLAVPLVVRGTVSGVLTWASSRPDRRYDEDDLHFAEHLARRSASALDNADLYSQTLAVAEHLQRAVLPGSVTGTEAWEVYCRYAPSGRTEVGGDFYDAFALDRDRYVVFVGDVMGRGVAAAAAMAQMRAAVRAFASVDPRPESVLDSLDRMVTQFETEQLVTLSYVLGDAAAGVVRVASAGHLPAFLRRREGEVERLPDADGPPLGLATSRRGLDVRFEPGDTLLVVTDGLVERRGEDLAEGLDRLAAAVPALSAASLEQGLDRLVQQVGDDRSDDDVAALVLRRTVRVGSAGAAAGAA
jgi:serine phosphatase RsbU (regulator of sigma subunit)